MRSDFDVVVCGGGTAGSVAAIRSARLGLKTALIERQSQLGGTSTLGLVSPLMANQCQGRDLAGGIHRELQDRLIQQGHAEGRGFDPLWAAIELERMAVQAGVTLLYHSEIIGCCREAQRVTAVEVASLGRRFDLSAAHFIDATGDAIIAMMAGAPTCRGAEEDGRHQALSLRFAMVDVDIDRVKQFVAANQPPDVRSIWPCSDSADPQALSVNVKWLHAEAVRRGYLESWQSHLVFQFYTIPGRTGVVSFNSPRVVNHDPASPESLTHAYIDGRKQIVEYARFFKNHVPGFESASISWIAPLIGMRECRRIKGEFVLTEQHVRGSAHFDDGICRCNYAIDIHDSQTGETYIWWPPVDQWYEIPYRALLPAELENVVVAGRCISSDFVAQSSYRIIPICRSLGDAAAYACFQANATGSTINRLDGESLRSFLFQ